MKAKRKCVLCPSHEYEYCTKCKDKSLVERWRLLFDKEDCRDIYNILSEFAFGRLSANDAKLKLDRYKVPKLEEMQPALRKNYEDVLAQATIGKKLNITEESEIEIEPIREYKKNLFKTESEDKYAKTEVQSVTDITSDEKIIDESNPVQKDITRPSRRRNQEEDDRITAIRARRFFRRNYE